MLFSYLHDYARMVAIFVATSIASVAVWLYLALTSDAQWSMLGVIIAATVGAIGTYFVSVRQGKPSEYGQLLQAGHQLRQELREEVVQLRSRVAELEAKEDELEGRIQGLETENHRLRREVERLGGSM